MYIMALNQSFQYPSVKNSPIVASPGSAMGMTIWKKSLHSDAPSIFADSTTASGMLVLKNVLSTMMLKEFRHRGKISAQRESLSISTFVTIR